MIVDVDPVAFTVVGMPVRWYTLLMVAGFVACYLSLRWLYRRDGRAIAELDRVTLPVTLAALVGARLAYCLLHHPERYLADPLSILRIGDGGLASHGGALAIVVVAWYARRAAGSRSATQPGPCGDSHLLWLLDRLAIAGPASIALVRIGNFINGELVGIPTHAPWGVVFVRFDALVRHPVQLYEALLYAMLALLQWRALLNERPGCAASPGLHLARALLVIGVGRLLLDSLKQPLIGAASLGGWSIVQWSSVVMIAAALFLRAAVRRETSRRGAPQVAAALDTHRASTA